MAEHITVEIRMDGENKWEAYAGFADFDTCLSHVRTLAAKEGRIVRLIVRGGLTAEQKAALAPLNIQING
jgi:hypothetical protein